MIKTICRSFDWASPMIVNDMYCDEEDYFGIGFWYNDVKEQHEEIEKQNKK